MELNIAVVDDVQTDCDCIKNMINQYFSKKENDSFQITVFHSGEEFFRSYQKGAYQILFLDICMENMNGIELSGRLRAVDDETEIVFMSTTTEFVFRTFSAEPAGYLCKPYTYEEFSETMDRVVKHFSKEVRTLNIKLRRAEISIPVKEIVSIVADNHNPKIRTITGAEYSTIMLFSDFERLLKQESEFLLCNRGILINMEYVSYIKNNDIIMLDGTKHPIKIREKKVVVTKFTEYTAGKIKRGVFI